jgi:hypothetical protein
MRTVFRFLGDHQSWLKLEGLLAICSLVWGLVVLYPTDTFGSGAVYLWLSGPEWIWGAIFAVSGALRLWAVAKRLHYLRTANSLLGFVRWGLLGVLFLLGNPASATAPIWLCFALASLCCYLAGGNCHINGIRCNGIAEAQLQIQLDKVEQMIPARFDEV